MRPLLFVLTVLIVCELDQLVRRRGSSTAVFYGVWCLSELRCFLRLPNSTVIRSVGNRTRLPRTCRTVSPRTPRRMILTACVGCYLPTLLHASQRVLLCARGDHSAVSGTSLQQRGPHRLPSKSSYFVKPTLVCRLGVIRCSKGYISVMRPGGWTVRSSPPARRLLRTPEVHQELESRNLEPKEISPRSAGVANGLHS